VLKAGKPSRIISITSAAMAFAATGFDDVDAPGEYYGMAVTGRAKLAHLTYLLELAQMLNGTGVSVFAADPGPAATGNAADMEIDILPRQLRPHWDAIRQGVTRPVAEAARSVIFTTTAPSLDGKTGLVIGQNSTPARHAARPPHPRHRHRRRRAHRSRATRSRHLIPQSGLRDLVSGPGGNWNGHRVITAQSTISW
jgi:hypothetical protein